MRRNRLVSGAVALAMAAGLLSGVVDAGAARIARPDARRGLDVAASPLEAMAAARARLGAPSALVDPAHPNRDVWLPTDDPGDMVVDPSTGRVYISMLDRVGVYDADGNPIGVVGGLREPRGLAVDGGVLYVAERGRATITLVGLGDLTVSRRITVPREGIFVEGATGVAVARGRIWYWTRAGSVRGLDPATGTVVAHFDGISYFYRDLRAVPGNPNRIVLTPDNVSPTWPVVLDVSTDTPTQLVPAGCTDPNGVYGVPAFVDATHFATATNVLREWTLDGQCPTFTADPIDTFSFASVAAATSAQGGLLASLGAKIDVYHRGSPTPFRHYDLPGFRNPLVYRYAAFSPDGTALYALAVSNGLLENAQRARLVVLHPLDDAPAAPAPAPTTVTKVDAVSVTTVGTGVVHDEVVDPGTGRVFVSIGTTVVVFDRDGTSVGTVAGVAQPFGLAVVGGAVVVADRGAHRLVRVNPATLATLSTITLPAGDAIAGLAATPGRLWYAADNQPAPSLVGLDSGTGAEVARVAVANTEIEELPGDPTRLLLWGDIPGQLVDIAPATPTVTPMACDVEMRSGAWPASSSAFLVGSTERALDGCPTGLRYLGPTGFGQPGATTAGGGVVATSSVGSLGDPDLVVFHAGDPIPYLKANVPDGALPQGYLNADAPLRFAADASRVYSLVVGFDRDTRYLMVTRIVNDGPPVVSDVSPKVVTTAGRVDVTITGTQLLNADSVTFDGVPGTDVRVVSASSVVVRAPVLAVGFHAIEVHTPQGRSVPSDAARILTVRELGSAGEFTPLAPVRLLDTRDGTGQPAAGPVGAGATIDLTVTGVGGVPADGVVAVVLNVTVTDPATPGYLTVYPTGEPVPLASNLNFVAGQTVPNLVVARVGAGGKVSFFNSSASTHVIADLAGWFSTIDGTPGTRLYPITPVRVIDTRGVGFLDEGSDVWTDLLQGDTDPTDRDHVKGWVLNVTVTEPTKAGYLTVHPHDTEPPLASNLNFVKGQTVPNLVMVPATRGGEIAFFNRFGRVHLVVDAVGFFDDRAIGDAGRFIPLQAPVRRLDTRDTAALGAEGVVRLPLADGGDVPRSALVSGVIANVTATDATAPTFVTVYPSDRDLPVASNLNVLASQAVPNLVVARTSADGALNLYNHAGAAHVIVDLLGWITSDIGAVAFG